MVEKKSNEQRSDFVSRKIDAMKKAHEMELRALKERQARELEILQRRLSSTQTEQITVGRSGGAKGKHLLN